jgi:hypothetical protein
MGYCVVGTVAFNTKVNSTTSNRHLFDLYRKLDAGTLEQDHAHYYF